MSLLKELSENPDKYVHDISNEKLGEFLPYIGKECLPLYFLSWVEKYYPEKKGIVYPLYPTNIEVKEWIGKYKNEITIPLKKLLNLKYIDALYIQSISIDNNECNYEIWKYSTDKNIIYSNEEVFSCLGHDCENLRITINCEETNKLEIKAIGFVLNIELKNKLRFLK